MAKQTSPKAAPKGDTVTRSKFDTIVVGAGASGMLAARTLQKRHPNMQILVLEAGERVCARLQNGFHLVDCEAAPRFDLRCATPTRQALKVRWERQWIDPDGVDWQSKEWWATDLPQWRRFYPGVKGFALALADADVEAAVKTRTPVRELRPADDGTSQWILETPEHVYVADRVVWAAGLTAFQNAVGKKAAQKYMTGNPVYTKDAADFRAALCLELKFASLPEFVDGLGTDQMVALPVRYDSKLYLVFAAFVPSEMTEVGATGHTLKMVTHLPQEILNDPKATASFEKAVRRTLKNALVEGSELPPESMSEQQPNLQPNLQSRWLVEERGPGHLLGTAWVLGEGVRGSLEFVGEESLAAARSEYGDVLGALDSVKDLSWVASDALLVPNELGANEAQIS